MPKRPSSGDLYYKIGCEARIEENPDSPLDYGNTQSDWVEQFQARAAYRHLRGGEDVIGSRLQGRHVQVIRVRSTAQTRTITPEWRVVDKRTGDIFNVRDVTHETDRQYISLLCEKGVAT